jgi:hypothetical protein
MGVFLRKYNTGTATGTHIGIPMIKGGYNDFAIGSDWTPAAGDVKVSIDGGVQANITTLPSYTNGCWIFQLSAAETAGKSIRVVVVSQTSPKPVEDQFFVIETFGNASAMYPQDFSTGVVNVNLSQVVPFSDVSASTTQTIGDCLSGARADAFGKWVFTGTTETIYGPDGTTVIRTFTLNDPTNPTQRT